MDGRSLICASENLWPKAPPLPASMVLDLQDPLSAKVQPMYLSPIGGQWSSWSINHYSAAESLSSTQCPLLKSAHSSRTEGVAWMVKSHIQALEARPAMGHWATPLTGCHDTQLPETPQPRNQWGLSLGTSDLPATLCPSLQQSQCPARLLLL
jgi:hypothetical protein